MYNYGKLYRVTEKRMKMLKMWTEKPLQEIEKLKFTLSFSSSISKFVQDLPIEQDKFRFLSLLELKS